MSYILQALKKSEEERHQDANPLTHHSPSAPVKIHTSSKQSILLWTSFLVFLLIAGISGYLLSRVQQNRSVPVQTVTESPDPRPLEEAINESAAPPTENGAIPHPAAAPAPPSEKTEPPAAAVTAPPPNQTAAADADPQPGEDAKKTPEGESPQVSIQPLKIESLDSDIPLFVENRIDPKNVLAAKSKSQPELPEQDVLEPAPLIAESETTSSLPPLPTTNEEHRKIPLLEQMPQEFKQKIPALRLAGHVYAHEPELRMILINNAIVRENDMVERILILDEIIPDGIILRSEGQRFRILAQ